MVKDIYPSGYECDCGHQSHFCENTVKEMREISFKKKAYLADSENEEHTIVFHLGVVVDILCPKKKTRYRKKGTTKS